MGKKHQKNKHPHVPAAYAHSKNYHHQQEHYHASTLSSSGASTKTSLGVTEKLSLMRQDDAAREAKAKRERHKRRMARLQERWCENVAGHGREAGANSVGGRGEMLEETEDDDDDDDDDVKDEPAVLDLNAATMPSVPPEVRKVLNLGEVPVLSGQGRKRWTGHRRVVTDAGGHGGGHRRPPPGPPPPKSWVTGSRQSKLVMADGERGGGGVTGTQKRSYAGLRGNRSKMKGDGRRYSANMPEQSHAGSSRPRCYFGLESQDPSSTAFHDWNDKHHHSPEKLSCIVARQMARYWDDLLEIEQYNLATLPARLKALLLGNIILYGPGVVTIRTLQVLFLNRSELEGATGAEGSTELDLSMLIGNGDIRGKGMSLKGIMQKVILSRRIREEDEAFPVLMTSSTLKKKSKERDISQQEDTTPDSWDAEDEGISNDNSISIYRSLTSTRFTDLTRLSLAHPQVRFPKSSPSSSSTTLPPSNHWSDLLALTKHLPTLTHLSLAHWPIPTLTPNSHTAYVSINPKRAGAMTSGLNSTAIPHGGTHFYSVLDNDWTEAVGILRRLSANTYCLQYLDLDGCADWWPALVWPRATYERGSGFVIRTGSDTAYADHAACFEDDAGNGNGSILRTGTTGPIGPMKPAGPTGIDWTGPWRQLHTLNLTPCSDVVAAAVANLMSASLVDAVNRWRRAAGLELVAKYTATDQGGSSDGG